MVVAMMPWCARPDFNSPRRAARTRAWATASVSTPANTVTSLAGFLSPVREDFTPGRAAPAAQPHTLFTTHITIAAVTIFLHRAQAHRALDLHPIVSHFFRFWLWVGTGMMPVNHKAATRDDINNVGSSGGLMTATPSDASVDEMVPGDIATAKAFGERLKAVVAKFAA